MSRFDHLYRRILLSKFFTKGWGKPENLKRLFEFRKIISNRETCRHLVASDYPVHIEKDEVYSDCRIMEGHFMSPFTKYLPGIMPKEVEIARFQAIFPTHWKHHKIRPVCLHLAGTGDHGYWRRRTLMARPLLKESGIASIILENPYYGIRKPKYQLRSSLHNVSDLFVMGGALILESLVLFHWCERNGWGPLGITGISMGGHMASLAATNWPQPISLVPCLSWSTASCVFTQGVMSGAIPWEVLRSQYFADSVYQDELKQLIHSPENQHYKAYDMGQLFVKEYSKSLDSHQENRSQQQHSSQKEPHKKEESNMNYQRSPDAQELNQNLQGTSDKTSQQVFHQATKVFRSAAGNTTDVTESKNEHLTLQQTLSKGKQVESKVRSARALGSEPLTLQHSVSKSKLSGSVTKEAAGQVSGGAKSVSTLQQEAVDFMRGVMDECTHLGNFSVPVDTRLIIIVAANQDAYIPRTSVMSLDQLWPGAEVRYIDRGHITAFLLDQSVFRKAIVDAFDRQIKFYCDKAGIQALQGRHLVSNIQQHTVEKS